MYDIYRYMYMIKYTRMTQSPSTCCLQYLQRAVEAHLRSKGTLSFMYMCMCVYIMCVGTYA